MKNHESTKQNCELFNQNQNVFRKYEKNEIPRKTINP